MIKAILIHAPVSGHEHEDHDGQSPKKIACTYSDERVLKEDLVHHSISLPVAALIYHYLSY